MKTAAQTKVPSGKRAKVAVSSEELYLQIFTPRDRSCEGLYTDQDSLEQPSQLIHVPSTTTPSAT
jgi:hypothetical protein